MNDQPESKTKPWKHIESDLKSALDSWEQLSQKYEIVISPEVKKLQEMRHLLAEIKNKIEELSKP